MDKRMMEDISNQVFGLGLMTATTLVMLIVTVVFLDPADAPTAAVLSVVLGSVTYVVWRFDATWSKVLGLLVTLAAASTIFYIAFGVFQLFSPLEFITGLLLVVGFLFALVGGIAGLMRRRQASTPGGRARRVALVLVAVGALASVGGFIATRTTVNAAEASGAAVVDMVDFLFEPEEVTVTAGERLLLTNSDAFAHDFTLEDYDIYTYFGPGSDALVDVSELPPGTYSYFCSLHTFDGEGMIGTLTVEG